MFKAIVEGARKIKRALSESDVEELAPEHQEVGDKIAQAFIAGRYADVYEMGAPELRQRSKPDSFSTSWADTVKYYAPLTGYQVANAGEIELEYIPGLEEVPNERFVAFLEIAFSSPNVPVEDEKAFAIGVVLLREGNAIRVGAVHAR